MPQVAIVGAGPLAGELAFLLARRDAASSIALLDPTGTIAAGKALDIMQAGPVESFSAVVSGDSDLFIATAAPVVVLADKAAGGEWQGAEAVDVLRQVVRRGRTSLVVCAGALHAGVIDDAVRDVGLGWRQILGSAPEALAAGARAMAALEARRSPAEVALSVLGVPPNHVVIPWHEATIGGFTASNVLDEPARRRVVARVGHLWPPGPLGLATAAAKAVMAALGKTRQGLSAFVAPDRSLGWQTRVGAMPVVLGPTGVERIALPPLSDHDRVALDNAMRL